MSSCVSNLSRVALAVALLGASSLPAYAQSKPAAAPSEDVDAARSHFKLGVDSYRDGDLTTAMIEFKRAYAAAPNYRLLYNLGQVARELRDYPEAERYFRTYLKQGGSEIDTARRQEVETDIAKASARIASLVISANEPDAELFVDDVSVGHAPLADVVRVSAGQRRVSATREGRRVTKVIDAAGGETLVVELKLEAKPAEVAASPQSGPSLREAPPEKSHAAEIALGVGTGALAVGAGVMAYLAAHDASGYRTALERKTDEAELKSLSDGAKTKALVTDVLLGATLACGVTTLIVAIMNGSEEKAPAGENATALGVGPGSVSLTSRF
jgi:tetratricopeptide (TPR) repeat protein